MFKSLKCSFRRVRPSSLSTRRPIVLTFWLINWPSGGHSILDEKVEMENVDCIFIVRRRTHFVKMKIKSNLRKEWPRLAIGGDLWTVHRSIYRGNGKLNVDLDNRNGCAIANAMNKFCPRIDDIQLLTKSISDWLCCAQHYSRCIAHR